MQPREVPGVRFKGVAASGDRREKRGIVADVGADIKEVGEIAQKAQTTAMSGITARAQQSVQEMTKLMQPK